MLPMTVRHRIPNNMAVETGQDLGEARAPSPEARLPDGRGGGSARFVPIHSTGY
jgi:hypothetical protein